VPSLYTYASVTDETAASGTQIPWLRQYTNAADLNALKALANEDNVYTDETAVGATLYYRIEVKR
jgi:hypothetical protein